MGSEGFRVAEEEGEKGGQKRSEEWTIYRKGAHSNGFPDAKHISAAPSKRRKDGG